MNMGPDDFARIIKISRSFIIYRDDHEWTYLLHIPMCRDQVQDGVVLLFTVELILFLNFNFILIFICILQSA